MSKTGEAVGASRVHWFRIRMGAHLGVRIRAEAELESFDGRFYIMRVRAPDVAQEIGSGTVGRAVVHVPSFVKRMHDKARGS